MSGTEETKKAFLASPYFAVVGASKDENKFGTKVLQWYIQHGKSVTPVHPKEDKLQNLDAIRTLEELQDPTHTSVSIITNPKITLGLVQLAKKLGIPYLWLQPDVHDDAVVQYINENGLQDNVIYGGACLLREGDKLLA